MQLVNPFISFSAGFEDPTSFVNLGAWYTARDASTITVDGSDIVTQWADKSGLANHATASAFVNPIYDGTDTISGIAVPQFFNAGANDCGLNLPLGLIRNLSGCTIIAVGIPGGSACAMHGFGFGGNVGDTWHDFQANAAWDAGRRRVAADAEQVVSGGSWTGGTPYIMVQYTDWQNTTVRIRINGVQGAESTTYQTSGNSADLNADQAFLGMASFDARGWRERLGEWMLYQRALDPEEISEIETYLSQEWSISI